MKFFIFGLLCAIMATGTKAALPVDLWTLVDNTLVVNILNIRYYEGQLNLTQNRLDHFIETIRHNNQPVERTIFFEAEALDRRAVIYKNETACIIAYGQVPSLLLEKKAVNNCANLAEKASYGVLVSAQRYITTANTHNRNLKAKLNTCTSSNDATMRACINDNIISYNKLIYTQLELADKSLLLALDEYDAMARNAVECIYEDTYNLATAIEASKGEVRQCVLKGKK